MSSNPNATIYAAPGNTTPFVGMILYTTQSPLSNPFDGQNKYWRLQRSSTVWAVEINTVGEVTAFTDCSTIPSDTPTPSVTATPTLTPTLSLTPTPTETVPPETPTPTPTQSPLPCYEYTATAGQDDIDIADGGTVYFNYTDCNGNSQTLQRGTTTPTTQCASSVGSVYIFVGGNQQTALNSSWTGPGVEC